MKLKSFGDSVFRQTNQTILYSILNTVLSILFFGIAARNSTVTFFGSQIVLISAAGALSGMLDFGSTFYHLREMSASRLSALQVSDAFITRTICIAFSSLILFPVGIIIGYRNTLILLFLVNLQMLLQFMTIPIRARGNTSILAQSLMVERLFSLVILLITIKLFSNPPIGIIIAFGCCASISFIIIRIWRLHIRLVKFTRSLHNPWKNVLLLGSTQILSQIQQLDLNLLASLTSNAVAAQYAAVSRWTSSIGVFSDAFSQSIVPVVSRANMSDTERRGVKKSLFWLYVSICSSIMIAVFSEKIVLIILGSKYVDSAGILRVLAIAGIATTITQPMSTYLLSKGLNTKVFATLSLGVMIQIVMICIYHKEFGAYSAAFGYFLGQATAATLLAVHLINYRNFSKNRNVVNFED